MYFQIDNVLTFNHFFGIIIFGSLIISATTAFMTSLLCCDPTLCTYNIYSTYYISESVMWQNISRAG